MSELKIKLENLQCTLTDPVSKEDIHAAWIMVEEIISEVTQLEELLKDVPGDSIEQKIQRIFHELEQAHKRIIQLEAESGQLRDLGIRTKSLLERSPGLHCDVHFFRGWTITRIDIQEEWRKALGGEG